MKRRGHALQEFWNKVRHGTGEAASAARRKLGLGEP